MWSLWSAQVVLGLPSSRLSHLSPFRDPPKSTRLHSALLRPADTSPIQCGLRYQVLFLSPINRELQYTWILASWYSINYIRRTSSLCYLGILIWYFLHAHCAREVGSLTKVCIDSERFTDICAYACKFMITLISNHFLLFSAFYSLLRILYATVSSPKPQEASPKRNL